MTSPHSNSLSAILCELERLVPQADRGAGATESEIVAAEQSLGYSFPSSYRLFLKNIGWIETPETTIFGIGTSAPAHLRVDRIHHMETREATPPFPQFLIPIMNDGAGNHYCLDCRESGSEFGSVVFWDHECDASQLPEFEAPDFTDWLVARFNITN